jgi:hypothetical protein
MLSALPFFERRRFALIRLNSFDRASVFGGSFFFDLYRFLLQKRRRFIDALVVRVMSWPFPRNEANLPAVSRRSHLAFLAAPHRMAKIDHRLQPGTLR